MGGNVGFGMVGVKAEDEPGLHSSILPLEEVKEEVENLLESWHKGCALMAVLFLHIPWLSIVFIELFLLL